MVARYAASIDKLPKVAVLVVSTRSGESDGFYTDEVQKTPFSHAVEGCDRPSTDAWDDSAQAACERDQRDLRFRYRQGGGQVAWAQAGYPMPQEVREIRPGSRLRSDGFVVHPAVSEAEVEQISQERMDRGFPGFPRNDEAATTQFQELVDLLTSHGVTVISTEIPYTPVHQAKLEQAGPDYDVKRQEVAAHLAGTTGIEHFPVDSFEDWWGDGSSRDAIHPSPDGAVDFADQLSDSTPGFLDAVVAGLD